MAIGNWRSTSRVSGSRSSTRRCPPRSRVLSGHQVECRSASSRPSRPSWPLRSTGRRTPRASPPRSGTRGRPRAPRSSYNAPNPRSPGSGRVAYLARRTGPPTRHDPSQGCDDPGQPVRSSVAPKLPARGRGVPQRRCARRLHRVLRRLPAPVTGRSGCQVPPVSVAHSRRNGEFRGSVLGDQVKVFDHPLSVTMARKPPDAGVESMCPVQPVDRLAEAWTQLAVMVWHHMSSDLRLAFDVAPLDPGPGMQM
jgi:hypothetical protein